MNNPSRIHQNIIWRALRQTKRYLKKESYGLFPQLTTKIEYFCVYKRRLNLVKPMRFTEKLAWLKLKFDPIDSYTIMAADKAGLRSYVHEKGLDQFILRPIGVYSNPDDIAWQTLPNSFVIKKSNSSNDVLIIKKKALVSELSVKKTLKEMLTVDFGRNTGQRHYSMSPASIVIEPYLSHLGNEYRFLMFNGVLRYIQVILWDWSRLENGGRAENNSVINGHRKHYKMLLDENWNILISDSDFVNKVVDKPVDAEQMIKLAKTLAADFPFVRVDLYSYDHKVQISELTFTPAAGFPLWVTASLDLEIGKKLKLPRLTQARK